VWPEVALWFAWVAELSVAVPVSDVLGFGEGMPMRLWRRCGLIGFPVAALLVALFAVTGAAEAAFPGRDGLLAVQPLKGSTIVLVKANGSDVSRVCHGSVTSLPGPCATLPSSPRPAWAADGRSLVVSGALSPPPSDFGGSSFVTLIYPNGSCLACLVPPYPEPPVIGSGDAAFTSDPTLVTTVWRVLHVTASGRQSVHYMLVEIGIDGLARRVLLSRSSAISDPVWSSRGELALVQGGWIWVGSPRKLRRLARGSAPSWSPNGKQIAFGRRGWVMIARARGGSVRRLVRGTAPAWSPDGRWIAFFDGRHRLSVAPAGGGRVRRVGKVTGQTVDWQPLPTKPPAVCRTPPGSTVVAGSETARISLDKVLATTAGAPPFAAAWAAMGCLRADGRERLLTTGGAGEGSISNVTAAAVAGNYAALAIHLDDYKGNGVGTGVGLFDLRTGTPVRGLSGDTYTNFCSPDTCESSIDQLMLGSDAVTAFHTTAHGAYVNSNRCSCTVEQIQADDSTGLHTLDSVTEPDGSPTALTNLTLTGDTLTWRHNGSPRSAQLQP
jgi:WD40-like Beta Propeller Repeat